MLPGPAEGEIVTSDGQHPANELFIWLREHNYVAAGHYERAAFHSRWFRPISDCHAHLIETLRHEQKRDQRERVKVPVPVEEQELVNNSLTTD